MKVIHIVAERTKVPPTVLARTSTDNNKDAVQGQIQQITIADEVIELVDVNIDGVRILILIK